MRLFPIFALGLLAACAPPPQSAEPPGRVTLIANALERQVPRTQSEITLSFAPVVKQAAPAVVNIYTKKVVERRSPFANDPFFRDFFGDFFPGSGRRVENSLGSGVIVDPSGVIVSNHHVVGDADEITVILNDRREFQAEVILSDEESDLAVLRTRRASDLPALELRDSDTLEVGDLVLAIGNPFGVGQTVTSGIVSALARTGGARGRGGGYFIQTDAPINPGNSGGALVDMTGRLVGVNTAIVSRSGGSNGIGFAVPANLVARVIESANQGLTMLDRPWLGLTGQDVTGELAEALGFDRPQGVLIEQLHPTSPFALAGLEPGDVLTELDGDPVDALTELVFRAATIGTGRSASATYLRGGAARQATLRFQPAPDSPARDALTVEGGALRGLSVSNVNPAVIDEFGLGLGAEGVLVLRARDRARRAGLRPGDLLLAVNGTPVGRTRDLPGLLAPGGLLLEVERGGKRGTIRIGG
ncbi:MAG: trypsin-like peptidase domain-containing protein [Pseudomonadota bacterium]